MWRSLIDRFLDAERNRGLKERSVEDLSMQLGFFEGYAEETGLEPRTVTAEQLRAWCVERVGTKSYATGKAVVWALKGLFGWLTLGETCAIDPSSPLRYPRYRPRQSLPTYLDVETLQRVLSVSHREDSFNDFALLSLFASTGLRPGDVVGLTRSNVYLEEQLIAGRVKGGWTKRTVLSDSMSAILSHHLAVRPDEAEALFVNTRGRAASPAYMRKVIKRAGDRAEVGFTVTPQILRHTFGTHAADRHGRTVTQALMGHRRGTTTELYTHLSPSYFRPLMNLHPNNDREAEQ